jgi:hypothetical protein
MGVTVQNGNLSTLAALTESAIAQYGGVYEMPLEFNPIKALQTLAVRKSPNPEWTASSCT